MTRRSARLDPTDDAARGIEWLDDDVVLPAAATDQEPSRLPVDVLFAGRVGERCCIRLHCAERGLPTEDARCARCDHRTQPLRDYRFPRTVFD